MQNAITVNSKTRMCVYRAYIFFSNSSQVEVDADLCPQKEPCWIDDNIQNNPKNNMRTTPQKIISSHIKIINMEHKNIVTTRCKRNAILMCQQYLSIVAIPFEYLWNLERSRNIVNIYSKVLHENRLASNDIGITFICPGGKSRIFSL